LWTQSTALFRCLCHLPAPGLTSCCGKRPEAVPVRGRALQACLNLSTTHPRTSPGLLRMFAGRSRQGVDRHQRGPARAPLPEGARPLLEGSSSPSGKPLLVVSNEVSNSVDNLDVQERGCAAKG
jgi:hypothetical protein